MSRATALTSMVSADSGYVLTIEVTRFKFNRTATATPLTTVTTIAATTTIAITYNNGCIDAIANSHDSIGLDA